MKCACGKHMTWQQFMEAGCCTRCEFWGHVLLEIAEESINTSDVGGTYIIDWEGLWYGRDNL